MSVLRGVYKVTHGLPIDLHYLIRFNLNRFIWDGPSRIGTLSQIEGYLYLLRHVYMTVCLSA
jgi:hypothetical protein